MELVNVNLEEFGVSEPQAMELLGSLPNILNQRNILEDQYEEIVKLPIDDKHTAKLARELRLRVRDNRTKGILPWHKHTKEYFLRAGQFIDAVKKKEVQVNERMESDLQEIENYLEIQEQKRIQALRVTRQNMIEPFEEFIPRSLDLGVLDDEEFDKVLSGARLQLEAKLEKERIEEEARLERERKELEERERIRMENEILKEKARLQALELKAQREEQELLEKRLLEENRLAEQKAKNERAALEAEMRKEREQRELEQLEERRKREEVEAELRRKEEAERQKMEEEALKVQQLSLRGDIDKIRDLCEDLKNLKAKYTFEVPSNKKMYKNVGDLLQSVIGYIESVSSK